MVNSFEFKFDDLVINLSEIKIMLGYKDGSVPVPFDRYLKEALEDASRCTGIRAVYRVVNNIKITDLSIQVPSEQLEFRVNKTISKELERSEKCAFFICTAGEMISEKSRLLFSGDDPVLAYIYDLLGSAVAEAAGDKIQMFIEKEAGLTGEKITNRYSPGYCHWDVSEQHKLFSLFNSTSGISLTSSALMHPVKSISGVIGMGKNVIYRDYSCGLCTSKNCKRREFRE